MTTHTDTTLESILTMTKEIKNMVAAERQEAALSVVHDKLDLMSRQHETIRNDLREILMLLAQSQATAAD